MIKFKNEVYDLESSHERYLLHSDLNEEFEKEFNWMDYTDEDMKEVNQELEKAHELISNRDKSSLNSHSIGFDCELSFDSVSENTLLINELKINNYQVEKSNASRSLYVVNDKGEEVRIADHKRPGYEFGGGFYEHKYENEIIVKNNTVYKKEIEKSGIKLPGDKYILG
ncbi:hypothetical protein BKP56_07270 [Marinilactibacillus sp. 15R]|uniref:hypothetical protein n=1 Tax=Marinilactibacillus sp. 15R TaxID=1911586 RepID=UPI00090975AF|nr:hypothetical protein [Marinilactibacillus sp. 15R]API89064.1 hypothetical protein BKP56_07270 [Marinilactibacillus sp. 15R]